MVGLNSSAIAVLGPVTVTPAQEPLSPKQQLLLGALALRGGVVPVGLLAELLWRERQPANPRAALQVHVSKLRRALAPAEAAVRRQGDGYTLVCEQSVLDLAEFERLARDGIRLAGDDPRRARVMLADALRLWRGSPLDGLADGTVLDGDVTRLIDTRLAAVHARIDADLALGHGAEITAELRQLTQEHPLHEGFWLQLMLALYAVGRAGEALTCYDEARRTLIEELGADPGPELQDAYQRILHQDPTLRSGRSAGPSHRDEVPESPADLRSVAVLPFDVTGGSVAAGPLAAGLHADLLVELARIPELVVISRLSVQAFAGTSATPAQVAAELGVRAVVTGSLQMAGERFRLAVELLDSATGTHLWAESYEAELHSRNLLAVQRSLAQDIAGGLSTTLHLEDRPPATTASLEAYRLAAEGRMQFGLKTQDGLARAVDLFRRAVAHDPDYVVSWLGLAEALAMTADYGYGDRPELLAEAETAVARCQALRPDLADVHVPRGLIAEGRWDAPTALTEYAEALRHIPGHADAHSWSAWVSLAVGEVDQALSHARRTVRLDPLSAEAVSNLALSLLAAGDPVGGLAEARRAAVLSPGYTTARYYEGLALFDQGRFSESVETLTPLGTSHAGGLTTPWAGQAPDAALAIGHVSTGNLAAAREVLDAIDTRAFPVEAGLVHLALGDTDQAHGLFAGPVPPGYGSAMLFHLHFPDLWQRLTADRRRDLEGRIARAWHVTPP